MFVDMLLQMYWNLVILACNCEVHLALDNYDHHYFSVFRTPLILPPIDPIYWLQKDPYDEVRNI